MGVKFEKQSRQVQTCMYILDQENKIKLFQKMSARTSVRAQKLCTLKLKNGQIYSRQEWTCIFLIRKKKENFFEKCLSVRLTFCPSEKILYTKTTERIKIIACNLIERFIAVIEISQISTRSHDALRSKSRLNFLSILPYYRTRLMRSTGSFFILKVWTRK